jgi:hypothetical protein
MKLKCIFFFLVLSGLLVSGQEKSEFFRKELGISVNHNFKDDQYYPTGIGFGPGFQLRLFASHKLNLVPGFEFNLIHFYAKWVEHSHFSSFTDVTYTMYNNTLPIMLRYNVGNKIKVFLEGGYLIDLLFITTGKGTYTYNIPNSTTPPIQWDSGQDIEVHTYHSNFFDHGFRTGLGLQFPVSQNDFMLKLDYTYDFIEVGLNEDRFRIEYLRLSLAIGF